MTFRSILFSLLLFSVSIGLSLIAIEWGTRILVPAYDPSGQIRFISRTDTMPKLGPRNIDLRQTKNTGDFDVKVSFNKYGLRDSKDLAKSSPDDLFVVGASGCFGWGVEERERFSDRIQALTGRPVFNLCIPGHLLDHEDRISYAEKLGAKIRRMVFVIAEERHLLDYEELARVKKEQDLKGSKPREFKFANYFHFVKDFLLNHSAIYRMVTTYVHNTPAIRNLAIRLGLIKPMSEFSRHRPYSRKAIESTVRRTIEVIAPYEATVVTIPSRNVWLPDPAQKAAAERIHAEFVELLSSKGLSVIDMKKVLEKNGDPLGYSFPNDGHWHAGGHDVVARALVEHMKILDIGSPLLH